MSKKKTSLYYMKLCRKALHGIMMTPADQGAAFLRLKNKAKKYLELAKKLEQEEKGTG